MNVFIRGNSMFVGRVPLPAVEKFIQEHADKLARPGAACMLVIAHDHDCGYPQGGECTCADGPEIRIAGDRPGDGA